MEKNVVFEEESEIGEIAESEVEMKDAENEEKGKEENKKDDLIISFLKVGKWPKREDWFKGKEICILDFSGPVETVRSLATIAFIACGVKFIKKLIKNFIK